MNEHDSERMKGMLESLGYSEAPARGEADLILFNTCSIREKADAIEHLRLAVEGSGRVRQYLAGDSDLDPLREEPAFQALLAS